MENYKEQIEQLRKQIYQLEQQINKPKIEVGKVYRHKNGNLVNRTGESSGFGINMMGNFEQSKHFNFLIHPEDWQEATPEEWTTALTKYCDELYKDCDRVDRSGLDLIFRTTARFIDEDSTELIDGKFQYKGMYVMDKHGKFAKGLKKGVKEMYINIYKNTASYPVDSLEEAKKRAGTKLEHFVGTFKLVEV